jgi:hypothetical protein
MEDKDYEDVFVTNAMDKLAIDITKLAFNKT